MLLPSEAEVLAEAGVTETVPETAAPAPAPEQQAPAAVLSPDVEGELLPSEEEVLAEAGVTETKPEEDTSSAEASSSSGPEILSPDVEGELLPSEEEVLAESGVTETKPEEESAGGDASSSSGPEILSPDVEGELLPSEEEVLAEAGVTETKPEEEASSSSSGPEILSPDVEGELLPSEAEVLAEAGVTETEASADGPAAAEESESSPELLSPDVEGELLPSEEEVLAEAGVTEEQPAAEEPAAPAEEEDDASVVLERPPLDPTDETDELVSEAIKRATNKAAAASGSLHDAEQAAADGDVAAALAAARDAAEAAAASAEEAAAALAAVAEIRKALNAKYVVARNARLEAEEEEKQHDQELEGELLPSEDDELLAGLEASEATTTVAPEEEAEEEDEANVVGETAAEIVAKPSASNAKPIVSRPKADAYYEKAQEQAPTAGAAVTKALSGSFDPAKAQRDKQVAENPELAKCNKRLAQYAQCGGKGNCQGGNCGDSAWEGTCCPYGWECARSDAYFWQCKKVESASGGSGGNAMPPPAPPVAAKLTSTGDVDYGVPLKLSFLFLEAQRSGKLPASQRVEWRGDTNAKAVAPWGSPIVRGYFDAGDGVLFNFPMAYAVSTVAWSVFEFFDGYKAAGQYQDALAAVKWGADYFLSAVSPDGKEIVAQVGNGRDDHASWSRPEDWPNSRPVYTIKRGQEGADVAAAMSAALAASAIVFAPVDADYSAQCLKGAKQLYEFALASPGKYHESVPDAASFYRSSNSLDDVAYAAAMLAVATGESDAAAAEKYASAAAALYDRWYKEEDGPKTWVAADWDSASWSAMTILSTRLFPNNAYYQKRMSHLVDSWLNGGDVVVFTPKGFAWSTEWGSIRHTANALYLMQVYSKYRGGDALAKKIDCFSHQQLRYALGFDKAGHSFVVGYGKNPPQRPHHRASSCPPMPDACAWDAYSNPGPNPQTLYGALVGGPGKDDSYKDDRGNYINNEVAMDYQAGFIGALAAMAESKVSNAQC